MCKFNSIVFFYFIIEFFFLNASYHIPQRHKSLSIVVVSVWVVELCVSVIHAGRLFHRFLYFSVEAFRRPPVHACFACRKGKWELLAGRRRGMLRHGCLYAVSSKASSLTPAYQSALSQPALCTGKWKERSWVFAWKWNLSRLQDVRIDKYLLNTLTGILIYNSNSICRGRVFIVKLRLLCYVSHLHNVL